MNKPLTSDKEKTVVTREHDSILSKGCKWITFSNFSYSERNLIYPWLKKIDIEETLVTRIHQKFFDVWLDIIPCKVCHNGVFVLPLKHHSYDYSEEGVLQPYCNNCGIVYLDS
jgi:hypothetical protein